MEKRLLFTFLALIMLDLSVARIHKEGYCMMYGQCGYDETSKKPITCLYNGEAKPLTDERGLQILQELCPFLYNPDGVTKTCCDIGGLETLLNNVQPAQQTLDRCPSCYRNFLNLYCSTTCSPNQSMFSNVTSTKPYTPPPEPTASSDEKENNVNVEDDKFQGNETVKTVDFYLSEKFASGMFNACKDVNFPSTNQKVMVLYCGQYGADNCSPQRWLDFLGSKSNGQTPFQMNFHQDNGSSIPPEFTAMDRKIHPCDQPFGNFSACSCQDCPKSCPPVKPPPTPPPPCLILDIDCVTFILMVAYAAFLFVFTIVVCTCCFIKGSNADMCCEDDEDVLSNSQNGKLSPEDVGCRESLGQRLESRLQRAFGYLGVFVAMHPAAVVFTGILIIGGLSTGFMMLEVITDPVELWSPPESTARVQKNYFDSHFGPFFRTEQLIIMAPGSNVTIHKKLPYNEIQPFGPVLRKDVLHKILDLQTNITKITAEYEGKTVTLEDICYAPLAPENKNCTITSVLNYFQNSHEMLDKIGWKDDIIPYSDYHDHIMSCAASPTALNDTTYLHTPCMGTFGGPVYPWVALGGYDAENYNNATVLVITFPVNNYDRDDKRTKMAEAWEREYINFVKNYSADPENSILNISFQAERSVEDEIERESYSDITTIAISYLCMFGYVSISLGQISGCERLLIDSKIILGLSGVLIVMGSVAASIGTLAFFGVPATLIVVEVVPFLVLAVGVDNIFILVQTYQREQRLPYESRAKHIGRVLSEVGPSMLLTSTSESVAFFLGALSNMPAVKAFSMYAAVAVFFDFLLQITCFIAMLTYDSMRQENNRYEIFCCIKNKRLGPPPKGNGILHTVVEKIYARILMNRFVRYFVIVIFSFMLFASGSFLNKISVGLDQTLSMPKDSYMLQYFQMQMEYLNVGAPVYFVVPEGFDYTTEMNQNMICGTSGCNPDSLTGQIYNAAHQGGYQHIAQPVTSWMDDYFDWMKSGDVHKSCCRIYNNTNDFCPSTIDNNTCVACRSDTSSRPTGEDFTNYLPFFLSDIPCVTCSKGGKAAYGDAISFKDENKTDIAASYFMTYHTVCRNSSDYILAIERARNVSKNITSMFKGNDPSLPSDFDIFPYSIFYVYYEQYLTIVHDSIINLSICTGAIFIITFLLLGLDLVSALICTGTITMITIDLLGVMYLWGIELNAVSLVNLVMSVGISVEFCSHITRAFAVSTKPDRVQRAEDALAHMGSSVLSGITLTKAIGIFILAFSKSQLFQVYYFRMYLGIVLLGGAHGLIFLPVALSYFGPSVNKAKVLKEQKGQTTEPSEKDPLIQGSSPRPHYSV